MWQSLSMRHAIDIAVPGADRRLEVVDDVVEVDLLHHPVGHFREQVLDAHVALERRAHFDDVVVDGAGGDRLLQTRVVVGLREVDPLDAGARIGLPRLQEAAEQEIVQVLVVQAHEGELTPLNSPGCTYCLVGPRQSSPTFCQSASVGEPLPAPGNLHDLADDAILGIGGPGRQRQ